MANAATQATLAAGAKVLQDDYGWTDEMSGMWILKAAILLNKNLQVDTSGLEEQLAEMVDE
jgi:hypothetical protein